MKMLTQGSKTRNLIFSEMCILKHINKKVGGERHGIQSRNSSMQYPISMEEFCLNTWTESKRTITI